MRSLQGTSAWIRHGIRIFFLKLANRSKTAGHATAGEQPELLFRIAKEAPRIPSKTSSTPPTRRMGSLAERETGGQL